MQLLITGTPGTGKTTLAKAIAKKLGAECVDVNALIEKKKIYSKKRGVKEKIVDLAKLRKLLLSLLKREPNVVVESHLLCEFALPCDSIVVLRCDPRVLKKRLVKRKYHQRKITENLLCEYLDYCFIRALENYSANKVAQVDGTKSLVPVKRVDWTKGREREISKLSVALSR